MFLNAEPAKGSNSRSNTMFALLGLVGIMVVSTKTQQRPLCCDRALPQAAPSTLHTAETRAPQTQWRQHFRLCSWSRRTARVKNFPLYLQNEAQKNLSDLAAGAGTYLCCTVKIFVQRVWNRIRQTCFTDL